MIAKISRTEQYILEIPVKYNPEKRRGQKNYDF